VWFPPGRWVDLFTGELHHVPRAEVLSVPLERMPLFARAGAVVPRQDYVDHVRGGAFDPLIVNVFAGDDGRFTLYEDEGEGFGYQAGAFTRTPLRWQEGPGAGTLTIGKARGGFPGDPAARRYSVRILGIDRRPSEVRIGGRPANDISYDPGARLLIVDTPALGTKRSAVVRVGFGR
jgi:hypothetical protein